MLKHLLFAFIILMLQSSSYASDEFDEEEIEADSTEVVDSFQRTYEMASYPWQLWNFASFQPRRSIPRYADDDEEPTPNADPRFVSDRCHSRHSFTATDNSCTTTLTSTLTVIMTVTETATSNPPLRFANNIYEITAPTDFESETTPLPTLA